jgi:type-F conjugative transfer system pilin assembly protein TrbC
LFNIGNGPADCRTSSLVELARENKPYQDLITHGNRLNLSKLNLHDAKEIGSCQALNNFQEDSLQRVEALKESQEFQEMMAELQKPIAKEPNQKRQEARIHETRLYVFVSFSMGEKALLNLAREGKLFGATLVLRGFVEGSYLKTAKAAQKIIIETGQGVLIDPELYTLFDITAVPTFVLARSFQPYAQERIQTPIHDKLQGHVSVRYALEQFAKEGDLKQEAQILLNKETRQ